VNVRFNFCCFLSLFLFATGLFSANAIDWYRWRGPDLNGISKEKNWEKEWPADGPKRLWKANVGMGFSSLTVSKGRVYTSGNSNDVDTIFCLDANTGKEIWKHSYDSPLDPKYYEGGTSATPTVDGDKVYSISKRGDLFCLDAAKGKVIWNKSLTNEFGVEIPTWGFAGSPLIEGHMLILNVGSAGVALDKKTGKVIWTSGTSVSGYSTPVPFNSGKERAILLCLTEDVGAFRLKDGKELWRYPWKTRYDVNAAEPIISGDKVFISSGYDHGAMLLKIVGNKPELVWENKNMRNHINSSVLLNGFVYGPNEVELACVDLETGEKKWGEKSFGKGSLMMADGKLIALSDKGELMIVEPSPEKFTAISRAQVIGGKCWTTPVLSNAKIYCRNAKGDVVCIDVSEKQTASK
jgi:outer membrane protein assembly factor BamB